MNPESCSIVGRRKTGAVSRMKSFQNCPGASGSAGGGASRMSRSSNPLASSVPAKDSSTMKTTRCPRRRRTSPIPTQLLVGPNAPSGKKTMVATRGCNYNGRGVRPSGSDPLFGVRSAVGAVDLVRENAVFGRHQLVLRAPGRFLHCDQMVERRDADFVAAYLDRDGVGFESLVRGAPV